MLKGKRIVLGVTGGIAAYKSAELTRLLREAGAEVRVAMTPAARAFVAPLTFQALSGHPVGLELLESPERAGMEHIDLARWADAVLIAPATADFLARLRLGLADSLLATLCLATAAPLAVAPAMNQAMWRHPATQDNLATLRQRNVRIFGPDEGTQACGDVGPGRMLEPAGLRDALAALWRDGPLSGCRVLVSAGPTREAIDPVRFLSNRSSGKMGFAVAEAVRAAGGRVTLVAGPTALAPPAVDELVRVESATEMAEAVVGRAATHDIFIAAAAVADYAPQSAAPAKIKKGADEMQLALRRTPDILGILADLPKRPFTVGFAAETDNLAQNAQEKLRLKRLDMIAANWVGREQGGFERDENALEVFWAEGHEGIALTTKREAARQLVELIIRRFRAQNPAESA
ncbi:MAG TPA: bifunctional phosphopantothenoylcysteine decarboxylase/phosphopantothenate--cysteine ligase CoaBC [Methylococcaceae bacterium]|nr:bifunctional phosphopantothenoylcysteine decarboxylase/phosphopantothenate--cysteine ligase CoaBC [Methylococcaceae bacterium]